MTDKALQSIGRAEKVDLIDLGVNGVPAKIDTGADSSTIWASHVEEKANKLHVTFFGPNSPYCEEKKKVFENNYSITRVANSFGQKELRYKVKLSIRVKGRYIRSTFTLSDRSQKTYPILLGRRLLKGKFIVDVSQGDALKDVEKSKAHKLSQELKRLNGRKGKT